MTIDVVLTSALIAAAVSGFMTLVGRYWERRSRIRELAFSKSLELAKARTELLKELAISKNVGVAIYDPVVLAERYFQWLLHLHEHGSLPDDPRIEKFPDK
jgi:hypothetical protein